MKKIKILMICIISIIMLLIISPKVEAKSYHIEDMNIKATVQDDGNVEIEHTLEYSFNSYISVLLFEKSRIADSYEPANIILFCGGKKYTVPPR